MGPDGSHDLDSLADDPEVAGLLALASAAAGGAPIGVAEGGGVVVAGRPAGPVPARSHPIVLDERTIGAVIGTTEASAELLALVARALELLLSGGRDRADRARVAHELAIGRRIQQSLLPRFLPDIEGWTFAAGYEPAREVGGDLFDVFHLRGRPDLVCLLIADVTGKGIPAALLMADVRALLHAAADNADGPADALRRVNGILVRERMTPLFVTAALLVVDVDSGTVSYASAGHEAPLVARAAGRIERLDAAGPILGAFADATFTEKTSVIEPGDVVLLYTDGLTETRDSDRGFYGEGPVLATLSAAHGRSAEAIRDSLVEDVRAFRGEAEAFDDLTLLVVERRPLRGDLRGLANA